MRRVLVTGIVWVALFSARNASAYHASPETRTVLRTGAWGLAGGTAVGLVILPFTGNLRSTFVGSSVGLYLGIVAGIYMITNTEDSANLLADAPRTPAVPAVSAPLAEVSLPILRF